MPGVAKPQPVDGLATMARFVVLDPAAGTATTWYLNLLPGAVVWNETPVTPTVDTQPFW